MYEATNLEETERYAVKVISERIFAQTPKIAELTKAEINILKDCNNPHVVKLIKTF